MSTFLNVYIVATAALLVSGQNYQQDYQQDYRYNYPYQGDTQPPQDYRSRWVSGGGGPTTPKPLVTTRGYATPAPRYPVDVIPVEHNPPETETDEYYDYPDENTIPGRPGEDYPIYHSIPKTSFSCINKGPGFFTDPETRCQAWYYCDVDGREDGFLCPNGTIYNQEKRVCEWWYNVHNCDDAADMYRINDDLYIVPEINTRRTYITLPPSYLQATSPRPYQDQRDNKALYIKTTAAPFFRKATAAALYKKTTKSPVYVQPTRPPIFAKSLEDDVRIKPTGRPTYSKPYTAAPLYPKPSTRPPTPDPAPAVVFAKPVEEREYPAFDYSSRGQRFSKPTSFNRVEQQNSYRGDRSYGNSEPDVVYSKPAPTRRNFYDDGPFPSSTPFYSKRLSTTPEPFYSPTTTPAPVYVRPTTLSPNYAKAGASSEPAFEYAPSPPRYIWSKFNQHQGAFEETPQSKPKYVVKYVGRSVTPDFSDDIGPTNPPPTRYNEALDDGYGADSNVASGDSNRSRFTKEFSTRFADRPKVRVRVRARPLYTSST